MKFYTEIKEGFLHINFDTEQQELATKIILDTLDNKDKVHETSDDLHTKVLTLSDFTQIKENEYKLDITDMDTLTLVVTIENAHQLAWDCDKLYINMVKMLTSFCNSCLDKVQKERVFLCSFRHSLFEYSVAQNYNDNEDPIWLKQAIDNYIDLDRIINQENTNCYDARLI